MTKRMTEADLLDRLSEIARISPTPESTATAVARARAIAASAPMTVHHHVKRRMLLRLAIPTAAVAAILVAAIMFLATGGASIAFADVAKRIRAASTMTFVQTMDVGEGPKLVTRFYIKSPGFIRWESVTHDGSISHVAITNSREGYHLTLIAVARRAYLTRCVPPGSTSAPAAPMMLVPAYVDASGRSTEMRGPQPPMLTTPEDFLVKLKSLVAGEHVELGAKDIGKRKVVGFRLGPDRDALDIWADATTAEPVEITKEITLPSGRRGNVVMSDFAFDAPLDDSLFSIRPPKDYTVHERPSRWSATSEDSVVGGLKALAGLNGGVFPERLTYSNAMMKAFASRTPDERDAIADRVRLMDYFLEQLPPGSTWGYVGAGRRLGAKSEQILWYAKPGDERCRVIFGDLGIRDVPVDQVVNYKPPASPRMGNRKTKVMTFRATGVFVGRGTFVSSKPSSTQPATRGKEGP